MVGKRLVNTGAASAAFDPLQNFESVAYTGSAGTQKVTGYIRKGAAFDGTNSKITTSYDALFNDFSISFWVKINDLSTYQVLLGTTDSYSSQAGMGIFYNSNLNTIGFDGNINGTRITSQTGSYQITQNQWYHVVFTNNSSNNEKILYIDNGVQVSNTSLGYINGQSYDLVFGSYNLYSNNRLNGSIDQFRIFNKALSSSEVTTLYGETYASSTKSTTDIFGDGSGVALYELDENANDTGIPIDSGQSGDFNGNNSNLENIYQIGYDNSISMWLNVDNTIPLDTYYGLWNQGLGATGYAGIRYKRNSGNNYTIEAFIRLGNDYIYRRNTSTTWNPGWNHFVFLVNSTTGFDFYLNGNNGNFSNWFIAGTFTNVDFSNETPVYLGKYQTTTTTFKGQMDDVRFYSDLLTTAEIGYLANNDTTNISTIGNFAAHYKLDGNANDSQGSNNGNWSGTEAYSDPVVRNYSGTPTNVNFVGMAFQPDLVWMKKRSNTQYSDHFLYDSVRGSNKLIFSNITQAEVTSTNYFSSFDANGFTVPNNVYTNENGSNFIAWCWKAGGAAVSNTDGSITSQVSANTDAGFSIVDWDATTTVSDTVGHGLDNKPELVIMKNRSNGSRNWFVFTDIIDGSYDFLYLNLTNSKSDSTRNVPTADVFDQGNLGGVVAGDNCIAYCFHSVDGYQKIGYYTSNASVKITTGFEPRWVIIKYTGAANDWWIMDIERYGGATGSHGGKLVTSYLEANTLSPEQSVPSGSVEFVSDGFYPTNFFNSNGVIYLAIA